MKVEVITVGDDLLCGDVINIMSAHVVRRLVDVRVQITCRVTVGQELALVADVVQTAVSRADVVIVIGGLTEEEQYASLQAIATLTNHPFTPTQKVQPQGQQLGGDASPAVGWRLTIGQSTLFGLPRQQSELLYLVDTHVLPWIQAHVPAEQVVAGRLLRTVGLLESVVRERLDDLPLGDNGRIFFDSLAGQTNIHLRVEGPSEVEVVADLQQLQQAITERLGDYIYGQKNDRLEHVIVDLLQQSQIRLVLAECNTGRALARLLEPAAGENGRIQAIPTYDAEQLADYLQMASQPTQNNLTHWCRSVAERLLHRPQAGLGLLVYNHLTPGGIQMLITLASQMGVSVAQRAFSGRPENIDQWVCSLSLAHLRRWLLVHK